MTELSTSADVARVVQEAERLAREGTSRQAIELLTEANRRQRDAALELALLTLRRDAGATLPGAAPRTRPPVTAEAHRGGVCEVDRGDLSVAAYQRGLERSGCLLVRGLVPPERVAQVVDGIDAVYAAYDATAEGASDVDAGWFSPCSIPDPLPDKIRRAFMRRDGGIVTAESPRMLFELFELVDDTGIGALMTELLGERPLLSANKCTLRRIEPSDVMGGWHQDGAFLGDEVGSFNLWLTLSDCGRDAPGLDIVPRRIDGVLPSDEESQFDWSLSERAVHAAAGELPIVRPDFRAGDALLFDHRLVHRTAADADMSRARYAIEAWFFAPSAYPDPARQLPILY